MNLFGDIITEMRSYLASREEEGTLRCVKAHGKSWPRMESGNLVLESDTAVELGNPRSESVSFVLWSEKENEIADGNVTIIGPDISEAKGKSMPFGKVVMLHVEGMNEDNSYERHRKIELARYELELEGYMLRAVSQYLREWSRVSNAAFEKGFSFSILAGELSKVYRAFDFVKGAEFVFVTSSAADVRLLRNMGDKAERRIAALSKMAIEMNFDCASCEYTDVCTEVEALRMVLERHDGVSYERRA